MLALLIGCGAESEPAADAAVDVGVVDVAAASYDWRSQATDAPGPYHVGHRVKAVTYTPKGLGTPRSIELHVWYPTAATDGEHPAYAGLFLDEKSVDDATLAPVAWPGKWPVLVHSHGHLGFAGNSAAVMRHFASHGWIAAAPDHTGNTLTDNLDPRPPWMYYVRSLDITASLDALEADVHGLGADLDTQHALLSGHSYGVHTGWATAGATFDACEECTEADKAVLAAGVGDARVVAAILMAGSINRTWFGPTGHASVQIPLLSMSGSADPVGADVQFDTTAGVDLTWIDVAGACHQSFGLGDCATLDAAEGFQIVGAWALAFGRRHVLADDSVQGLLSGAAPVSRKVTVKHHD